MPDSEGVSGLPDAFVFAGPLTVVRLLRAEVLPPPGVVDRFEDLAMAYVTDEVKETGSGGPPARREWVLSISRTSASVAASRVLKIPGPGPWSVYRRDARNTNEDIDDA